MGPEANVATHVNQLPAEVPAQREDRRRIVASALGSTLAEGVSPGPEVLALSERYVDGEITLEELGAAVRKEYGI